MDRNICYICLICNDINVTSPDEHLLAYHLDYYFNHSDTLNHLDYFLCKTAGNIDSEHIENTNEFICYEIPIQVNQQNDHDTNTAEIVDAENTDKNNTHESECAIPDNDHNDIDITQYTVRWKYINDDSDTDSETELLEYYSDISNLSTDEDKEPNE